MSIARHGAAARLRSHRTYCVRVDARGPRANRGKFLAFAQVGRRIDVENIVGAAEIANRLGVRRPQVVHDWIRRFPADSAHPFPPHVAQISKAKVWNWPEVERWARATGRLPR